MCGEAYAFDHRLSNFGTIAASRVGESGCKCSGPARGTSQSGRGSARLIRTELALVTNANCDHDTRPTEAVQDHRLANLAVEPTIGEFPTTKTDGCGDWAFGRNNDAHGVGGRCATGNLE